MLVHVGVFLDGGDALGYDQAGNTTLYSTLGLASTDDGDMGATPPSALQGQAGSIVEGLVFTDSEQLATTTTDRFQPGGSGLASFVQQGYGTVGVKGGKPFVEVKAGSIDVQSIDYVAKA